MANIIDAEGVVVHDALVLIDRWEGGRKGVGKSGK